MKCLNEFKEPPRHIHTVRLGDERHRMMNDDDERTSSPGRASRQEYAIKPPQESGFARHLSRMLTLGDSHGAECGRICEMKLFRALYPLLIPSKTWRATMRHVQAAERAVTLIEHRTTVKIVKPALGSGCTTAVVGLSSRIDKPQGYTR